MELNLKGRKVLITGTGEGIGRELALAFAKEGALVAGCARGRDRLDSLAREIEGEGHLFQTADVTRPKDIEAFHNEVEKAWGGLDILINNAGLILNLGDFFSLDDDDWRKSFEVNLLSTVRMCRTFIPMLRRSDAARIINISSNATLKPGVMFPHYNSMKAGLSNLTASLAQTLAGDKILVNAVSPGPIWSRSWENEAEIVAKDSARDLETVKREIRTQVGENTLLKRMGVPQDITGIILFLASKQAGWITGGQFTVDGGITLFPF